MLNKIILQGRLTRDPELRSTTTGTPVASFSLAVDRGGKDKGADFIDCVAWRKTGEFAASYFKKGSLALVEGKLQIRDWTDKDGNKRKAAEVVVDNMHFCGPKQDAGPIFAPVVDPIDELAQKFEELNDDSGSLPF